MVRLRPPSLKGEAPPTRMRKSTASGFLSRKPIVTVMRRGYYESVRSRTKNNTPKRHFSVCTATPHRSYAPVHETTATKGAGQWQTISINRWSTRSGSKDI